jgi:putative membrane protein
MSDSKDIENIHKRYTFTLINPSSFYVSLFASVGIAAIISALVFHNFIQNYEILYHLPAVIAVLLVTQYFDSRFTRHKEYSKSLHMSFFGNILWLITVVAGILGAAILSKDLTLYYVALGMFIFSSFRIGIMTTTLGISLKKSCVLCFVQPLAMFLILIPVGMWSILYHVETLAFAFVFLAVAIFWSYFTNRSGLPGIKSTHKLLQAYLQSVSRNDPTDMESIILETSKQSQISTSQIRFYTDDNKNDFRMILPDLHPGPFHPVGGSDIPHEIYKTMNSSAMVLHSVSDHSLNLPSRQDVKNYLDGLLESSVSTKGLTCTEPITAQINKARAVGLRFDQTAVLFLSLSPHGMEDVPLSIKTEIEQIAKNRNFQNVLVVDTHNAMGGELSQEDTQDMITAAKSVLDILITKSSYPLRYGYANSKSMDIQTGDLAGGGIGVLCLAIDQKKYFLCWADANNIENGIREKIVVHLQNNGCDLVEMFTSDTHFTTMGVRNRNGYYQLGIVTKPERLANWCLSIAKQAEKNIVTGKFEILENQAKVRVMGTGIFEHLSRALDSSLRMTKIFMVGCVGIFLLSIFLWF